MQAVPSTPIPDASESLTNREDFRFHISMPDIVLATLNARYSHSSFGLRYLMANLGPVAQRAVIREFTISDQTTEILAAIVSEQPRIVGFSVYIWNVEQTERVIRDLRLISPQTIIVLGGPEVSYEIEQQSITPLADYIITGEADLAFAELCDQLLSNKRPENRIIHATPPQPQQLRLPYDLYTNEDIANRVIYVEASRGCPFTCEFCLSALDIPVRAFQLESFLAAMQSLLQRGVKQFKFVDRTFNLNLRVSRAILEFFLERWEPGLFLHFELIPDRLPESLRDVIEKFPPGSLQFEIGIQSFNDDVNTLISRPQDESKVVENLSYLRVNTSVHLHTDLIVGLPGEDLRSFAAGFNRLYRLKPQEIQVGILKRLRGTPIIRHDDDWQMVYSQNPPYEIMSHRLLSFDDVQSMRLFARFWDLIGNSGNFRDTLAALLDSSDSPFDEFMSLANWIHHREGRRHGIALIRLAELLFEYLTTARSFTPQTAAEALWEDYIRNGRRDRPGFLRSFELRSVDQPHPTDRTAPSRQSRHLPQ